MYNQASDEASNIRERTYRFGVGIVKLVRTFPKENAGFVIGNQVIRSGTSIGANVEEAQNSGSKKEFIRSMTIALKEARETEFWLRILGDTGLVEIRLIGELLDEVRQLIRILTTIIKNTKNNLEKL